MALNNLGMVRPGTTLQIPFPTYSSDDPSKSITVTELDVGAIQIYKDANLTQRVSTTGFGVDIDVDATVGVHWITIDLASNATAGFYASGSRYIVVVLGLVIDGATAMATPVATFEIGYPNAIINTTVASVTSQTQFILTSGPAEADVLIGCKLLFHDVASAVQLAYSYVTDYIVTTKEVICTDPVGFTFVATDNVSIFMPDNLGMSTGMMAEVQSEANDALVAQKLDHLVAVADADDPVDDSIIAKMVSKSATADWSNFLNVSDSLEGIRDHIADGTSLTEAGGTGDHLNAIPWNSDWDVQVQSEVNDALVALHLDHLFAVSVADEIVDDSAWADLTSKTGDWSTFNKTTDSLEAIKDSGGGDVNVTQWLGTACATPDTAGIPKVNTEEIAGTTQTAADVGSLVATVGVVGAGLTDLGGMSTAMLAEVQVEADAALVAMHLDHMFLTAVADEIVNDTFAADLVSTTGDWSTFVKGTDSLQAQKDNVKPVNVTEWSGTSVPAPDTAGYPIVTIKDGVAQGELDITSGTVDSNVVGWLGTAPAAPTVGGVPEVDVTHLEGTTTVALPGQTAPPLAPTLPQLLGWLYKVLRNRTDQTSSLWQLYADNETTVDAKATVSDDTTTAVKQEIVTGP